MKNTKYLVIGGGPIGLYTAYKILTTNSNLTSHTNHVTLFEKRPCYTRNNIIRIDNNDIKSFDLFPDVLIQKLLQRSTFDVFANVNTTNKPCIIPQYPFDVVISEFETSMSEIISSVPSSYLDIIKPLNESSIVLKDRVLYWDNSSLKILDYDYVLVCDGVNGQVKRAYFGTNMNNQSNEWYFGRCKSSGVITPSITKANINPICYGLTLSINLPRELYKQCHPRLLANTVEYLDSDCKIGNMEYQSHHVSSVKQKLFRLFMSKDRIFITLMIDNSIKPLSCSCVDWCKLPCYIKTQVQFILHYYGFGLQVISSLDQLGVVGNIAVFPLYYSQVNQSCKVIESTVLVVLGDALVSGNFHTGTGFNKNLVIADKAVQLINRYNNANAVLSQAINKLLLYINYKSHKLASQVIQESIAASLDFDAVANKSNQQLYQNYTKILHKFMSYGCYDEFYQFVMNNSTLEFCRFLWLFNHGK